jgi:hypothetical protein
MGKDWNDQLNATKIMQKNPEVRKQVDIEINNIRQKLVSR